MNRKLSSPRSKQMLVPTIVLAIVALILVVIAAKQGQPSLGPSAGSALRGTLSLLPLLFCALLVAELLQGLISPSTISTWVGAESGMRGILLGSIAGGLAPGGPFVSLPVAVGLVRAGCSVGTIVAFLTGWSLWAFSRIPMELGILGWKRSVGTIVAFLTGWSLWAFSRIPMELGILGWKLTLIRLAATLVFPPIAGLIAQLLFGGVRIS
jgi:uncharacterized membrane protein YraQ (UPF0718 family)